MPTLPPKLLVAAGLLTWAVMAAGWVTSGGLKGSPLQVGLAVLAWVLFAVAFCAATLLKLSRRLEAAMLVLQSAAVLALTALGHGGLAGVLFAVVAGQLGMAITPRIVMGWLVVQTVAFVVLFAAHLPFRQALFTSIGYFGFQLFAFGASRLATREAEGRTELARVNAELRAAQALLADSARNGERLRISRELHDAMGHHLTALALQLEVARNTAPGNEAVLRSRELARSMLTEVRAVVGALREDRPFELRQALELLAAGVSGIAMKLELEEGLTLADPRLAHAVYRCVQEAVTNAVRHASATTVEVRVASRGQRLHVEVRDDGRAPSNIEPGNGLTGLRERLTELDGTLELSTTPGPGLTLTATLPLDGAEVVS